MDGQRSFTLLLNSGWKWHFLLYGRQEKKRKEIKTFDLYTRLLLHNYGLELIEYPVAFCTVYANDDQKWILFCISLLTYLKVTYCE